MRRWQCYLLVAWICLSVGCTTLTPKHISGKSLPLQGTTPQIRERLLSEIPLGTPSADAKRIAISLGLEPTPGKLVELPGDNTLHFQKEGKQWWGGRKICLIQIVCPDGVVEDIFCEQIGVEW